MTKREAYELLKMLVGYYEMKMPSKFAMFIVQNKHIIEKNLESLLETVKPSQRFMLYEQARIALLKKYADKDAEGKPMIRDKVFVIKGNKEKFEAELEELQSNYSDILEEAKSKNSITEKILDEEADIELKKINLVDIPDRILSPREMELFSKLSIIDDI